MLIENPFFWFSRSIKVCLFAPTVPVVEPTIAVFWSTASRNWPMTRGMLCILFTSSWACRNSFFRFFCSSLMYSSCTSRNSSSCCSFCKDTAKAAWEPAGDEGGAAGHICSFYAKGCSMKTATITSPGLFNMMIRNKIWIQTKQNVRVLKDTVKSWAEGVLTVDFVLQGPPAHSSTGCLS